MNDLRDAINDVRMAAEANGHGWVTGTDAWARLLTLAAPSTPEPSEDAEAWVEAFSVYRYGWRMDQWDAGKARIVRAEAMAVLGPKWPDVAAPSTEPALDVERHGYTCGLCRWGRDRVADRDAYTKHMAESHRADNPPPQPFPEYARLAESQPCPHCLPGERPNPNCPEHGAESQP